MDEAQIISINKVQATGAALEAYIPIMFRRDPVYRPKKECETNFRRFLGLGLGKCNDFLAEGRIYHDQVVLVEAKGKDVPHAINQFEETGQAVIERIRPETMSFQLVTRYGGIPDSIIEKHPDLRKSVISDEDKRFWGEILREELEAVEPRGDVVVGRDPGGEFKAIGSPHILTYANGLRVVPRIIQLPSRTRQGEPKRRYCKINPDVRVRFARFRD
jgi:hypothetical protein